MPQREEAPIVERHAFATSVRHGPLIVAAVICALLSMPAGRAQAAQLTANAVATLDGLTLAYQGTNFPRGSTVQIRLTGPAGMLPLGAATAGPDGSFQGMASLHCIPPGYAAQEQATISAVQGMNGSPLAAASVSFACLLQR